MTRRWRWLIVPLTALIAVGCGFLIWRFLGHDISGIVTDIAGKPIAGAEIPTEGGTVKTDENGRFTVHLPPGEHEITAAYDDETGSITMGTFDGELPPGKEDPLAVSWSPGDPDKIFGDAGSESGITPDEIDAIEDEIANEYYPQPPKPERHEDIGSINLVIPTLLEEPSFPPPVSMEDFVINEEGLEVVKGEILVGWISDTTKTDRENIIKEAGGQLHYDSPETQTSIVFVDDQKKVPDAVKTLQESQKVTAAMANYRLFPQETPDRSPNDPDYKDEKRSWWLRAINAQPMWEITKRGTRVYVAVIDVGFNMNHPDLQGVFTTTGWNYTTDNMAADADHGTHVSGIIGAKRNNGQGLTGVTNKAIIFPFKLNDVGRLPDIFAKINTYQDLHIVSMSIGWNWAQWNASLIAGGRRPFTAAQMEEKNRAFNIILKPAFEQFYKEGGVACQSAGNDYGMDADVNLVNLRGAIVVGASTTSGSLTDFSNIGNRVDVVAPGQNIWSTIGGGKYGYMSGTSMATPATCGVVAAIRSVRPGYGALMIRQLLRTGGKKPKTLAGGYLNLDAWRALLKATNLYGVKGDVYSGNYQEIADAKITTKPAKWSLTSDINGQYLIPWLLRSEDGWIIEAEKDKLKGHERAFAPHIFDDPVRTVSIYLEEEKETQETEEETQQPTEEQTEEAEPEGQTTDTGGQDGSGEQGGQGDQDSSGEGTTSPYGQGAGGTEAGTRLENGIILSAEGCAVSGFEQPQKEDEQCGPGFYFSRDTIACEQKVCPEGAGRTYTLECKCPEGTRAIYACGVTGYVVACAASQ